MADGSAIEWTDATWNPVTGCTKITAGCDNCYAERFAERWRGIPGHPFENGFDLTLRPDRLDQPLRWKRSRMIFVNSMSDLFHKGVPTSFVDAVFDTMEAAEWHIFQVLTKRSSRMRDYLCKRYRDRMSPEHIWLGVSVEDAKGAARVEHLRAAPAAVRFLSVEPLIGPVGKINLSGIHWVIAGGEAARAPVSSILNGLVKSGMSAHARKSHFSSSNGVGYDQKAAVVILTGANGMSFRLRRSLSADGRRFRAL